MTKLLRRMALGLAVAGVVVVWSVSEPPARGDQQVASVENLKSEAFKAIRGGDFDRSTELLEKAAAMSQDPALNQMAHWTTQFESQQQVFATERR